MEQQDWTARVGTTIATEVRRHRLARGMSAQQLSDACGEIGASIPRTVISNIENGRRTNVTVAEALALAAALRIAPAALIFPAGYVEEVEFLPEKKASPLVAIQWLSGEAPLPLGGGGAVSAMMRTVLFFMRQIITNKRKLEAQTRDMIRLADRANEAADQDLRRAYEAAARAVADSHSQGIRRVQTWVEELRKGMPEFEIGPVPYPDPELPSGMVDIEMVTDPDMLLGSKSRER